MKSIVGSFTDNKSLFAFLNHEILDVESPLITCTSYIRDQLLDFQYCEVSQIDQGILTQLNTELTMSLGNENERREAIRNASADLFGFERELQVMGRGQVIVSASYKDIPLPIQVSPYDGQWQDVNRRQNFG